MELGVELARPRWKKLDLSFVVKRFGWVIHHNYNNSIALSHVLKSSSSSSGPPNRFFLPPQRLCSSLDLLEARVNVSCSLLLLKCSASHTKLYVSQSRIYMHVAVRFVVVARSIVRLFVAFHFKSLSSSFASFFVVTCRPSRCAAAGSCPCAWTAPCGCAPAARPRWRRATSARRAPPAAAPPSSAAARSPSRGS